MAQPIWNTTAGLIGTYLALTPTVITLSGSPVLPATSVTYTLISGSLPAGLTMTSSGIISGTPSLVTTDTTNQFVVRLTDNLNNIRDRTFSLVISGSAVPSLTTPDGNLLTVNDSTWVELQIGYNNPIATNLVDIYVFEGSLPPGLEINETGLIRGYASPPFLNVTIPEVTTTAQQTSSSTNYITCFSTVGFSVDRPIMFSGSVFGNILPNVTYYIKSIINATTFSISSTIGGPSVTLTTSSGNMDVTLPAISTGEPTIKNYTFTIKLSSDLGSDTGAYSITIVNQNTPISQGGPGLPSNSRVPTIYNTRPPTYQLNNSDVYYGYYILPPASLGYDDTYPPSVDAYFGVKESDNYFAFKIIGHDFDGSDLVYLYSGLPTGLTGNPSTGWITGTPVLNNIGLNRYSFSVSVYKSSNPAIQSTIFNYSFDVSNEIVGTITWISPSDLGSIMNGTVSNKNVVAVSDVDLKYRLTSGSLPPNLSLDDNGEIIGCVANQPADNVLRVGDQTTFTFTVEAYSPVYPIITSSQTFTLIVVQVFDYPTDTLYVKATPSVEDRIILDTLLDNDTLIPPEMVYRATDQYFGKASSVIYEHAYGIHASSIDEYIASITENHYWRNITLGSLETAVAKDDNGNIIYEVVYSKVIDDLVNPEGASVSKSIRWPQTINLFEGPWYTSVTNIYTSYSNVLNQLYYTSLSPGYVNIVYPNSLLNMRTQVADVLGQESDSRLLPLWMRSQQENGSTLGYITAWVICYTKPGFSSIIKNNIDTLWLRPEGTPYKLNEINVQLDRFSVNKSITYNYDNNVSPPAWTGLPSATPTPNPLDSKDFYVLFPHKTILPNR